MVAPPVAILCNDRRIDVAPLRIVAGRVLVPVDSNGTRRLFERLRAFIAFDAATRTVSVSFGEVVPVNRIVAVSAAVGSNRLTTSTQTWSGPANGLGPRTSTFTKRPLSVSPEFAGGAVYAPLRVFAEAAGAYVEWSALKRIVVLRKLPPSAAELQRESEARDALRNLGRRQQQQLENAAKSLK